MKHKLLLLTLLLGFVMQSGAQQIQHIEPPNWWVGMHSPKLQLMLHSPGIAQADLSINYPNVHIERFVRTQNPNYLFVDLHIDPSAPAGTMQLQFSLGRKKWTQAYELKQRRNRNNAQQGLQQTDVVYLIMPDRFANGNPQNDSQAQMLERANRNNPYGRHGGDIVGLTQQLDYIADLGATAIWLTPFQENNMPETSFHGYAMTDMYNVDPRLGTNTDFANYVEKAHQKGLKTVFDVVFNQIGLSHWWMNDLPAADWINQWPSYTNCNWAGEAMPDSHASELDKRINVEGWFNQGMPDMNQANPEMWNYLVQWSIWWVEFANFDAIRFDTYQYNKPKALKQWAKRLYAEYPEMYYCSEVWVDDVPTQSYWQKNIEARNIEQQQFPGMIDFPLYEGIQRAFRKNGSIYQVYKVLTKDFLYADAYRNLSFFENHDTDRFLGVIENDRAALKQATALLLTTRGIPQIYYGTEILMNGLKQNGGDAQVRFDMPGGWSGDAMNVFANQGLSEAQQDYKSYLTNLLNWRKKHPELISGELRHFIPQDEVYVYFRLAGEKALMVVLNHNTTAKTLNLVRFAELLGNYKSATDWQGKSFDLHADWQLEPQSSLIIELN